MDEIMKLMRAGGTAATSAINPVSSLVSLGAPLFQGLYGLGQKVQARAINRRNPRPGYSIPGAATLALNNQQNLAMGNAPGLETAIQQLQRQQAGSRSAIMNSGGGGAETLAALALQDRNASDSALQLGAMQDQWKAQQMQNLIAQQDAYSRWQEKKQDWESIQPYMQAMEKASQLETDSNYNIHNAMEVGGEVVNQSLGWKGEPREAAKARTGLATTGALAMGVLGAANRPARTPATKPTFNPSEGADVQYDFQGMKPSFNPSEGSDTVYDFESFTKPVTRRRGKDTPFLPGLDRLAQVGRAK